MSRRPDTCPDCGASATAHTGPYCHECGADLVPPTPRTETPREAQARQAVEDSAMLESLMDLIRRDVFMPWATVDSDGDVVLFTTEELADAYVDEIHGGDPTFKASRIPIRFEPEPSE